MHVVAKARAEGQAADARLAGVDLPGMEIEDRGLPVFPRDAAQGPARDAVGQQAEVAAATTRQVAAAQAERGDRPLDEGVPVARPEAEAGGRRVAVGVVGGEGKRVVE